MKKLLLAISLLLSLHQSYSQCKTFNGYGTIDVGPVFPFLKPYTIDGCFFLEKERETTNPSISASKPTLKKVAAALNTPTTNLTLMSYEGYIVSYQSFTGGLIDVMCYASWVVGYNVSFKIDGDIRAEVQRDKVTYKYGANFALMYDYAAVSNGGQMYYYYL